MKQARLRKFWDTVRSSYWFVPSVMMVGAALLWLGASWMDHLLTVKGKLPSEWLYYDDRASERALLLTIAASTIGIVGVVFSIMMVPLTIAATQFGPRLLRNFLRDTGTQMTLGTFMATFLFCMLVIVQLREEATRPLPQFTVTIGLLLGVASFAMLIYFINHVAVSIQASVVVAEVSDELHKVIDREFPKRFDKNYVHPPQKVAVLETTDLTVTPYTVIAKASGYVQVRDDEGLLHFAQQHDLVMELHRQPGDFVTQYTKLASVWPMATAIDEVENTINAAFMLGAQRTLVQDVTFGINSLVEVAVRALSPAINDPFTAMTCLDWLGTALCRLCARTFPPSRRYDEKGKLRLITSPVTFTALTDAAFIQIRDYGRSSTMVLLRMLETIATVAQCVRTEEQRTALLQHAKLVERSSHIGLPETADRQAITDCYLTALHILDKCLQIKVDQ